MYSIIGGGIGGLTLALAFEKLGIDYRIFERAPKINEVGAGIWLAPNALQVFDWLGVLEEVQKKGNAIERIQLAQSDLRALSNMDQSWVVDRLGFSTIAIHRAKLQKILFHAVPKEKIFLGKSLAFFEAIDENKLQLSFSDGTQYKTDSIVGADGIHSTIRKQLFPDSRLRYSGQTCWRGIADIELAPDYTHLAAELWGPGIRIGFSSISERSVYWFGVKSSKADQIDPEAKRKDKLLNLFSNFHPIAVSLIENTPNDHIIQNDIWDLRPMKQWYQGRVCLIGDAAHAMTPNMGQGAAQAIEDAYFLANQITRCSSHSEAFAQFQALRRKKVREVVNQSWNIGKMAHWSYGRGLRNLLMRSVPASFSRKQMLKLYQLGSTTRFSE